MYNMANSESDDFESADEEMPKTVVCKEDFIATSSDVPLSDVGVKSSEDKTHSSGELDCKPPSESVVSESNSSETSSSTEHWGAKPKILQGSSRRYNAKEKSENSQKNNQTSPSSSIMEDTKVSKRQGPLKLGTKIQRSSQSVDAINSDEICGSNGKTKERGKVRVTWSVDVKDDYADGEGMPPLSEKLTALRMDDGQAIQEKDRESSKTSTLDHPSGWSSWGSWGVSTILSGASSVTNHVTQSLSTVTSAIETGLGAVGPEEMARISMEDKKASPDTPGLMDSYAEEDLPVPPCSDTSSSGLLSMGNVLRFMESTGGMIVASGLNTLETIGKKTMDVLQEGDPGFKKKRALLARESEKPSLSQVLKEARLKAECEDKERTLQKKASKAHFETLFDDYRGMVHLEALEMLSHTCQMKLEAKHVQLSGSQLLAFQRTLAHIKEQCELPDEDDEDDGEDRGSLEILERDLSTSMKGLMVSVPHTKLLRISGETDSWLNAMKCANEDECGVGTDDWADKDDDPEDGSHPNSLQEIHQQAICTLAQFTAAVTEHFHKIAELLLLKEEHDSGAEAHCLVLMTTVLCSRVSSVAARFSELLSATANMMTGVHINHNDVNSLITNVFLEASNSSSYIQDASNLLIPVLQLGAVQ